MKSSLPVYVIHVRLEIAIKVKLDANSVIDVNKTVYAIAQIARYVFLEQQKIVLYHGAVSHKVKQSQLR